MFLLVRYLIRVWNHRKAAANSGSTLAEHRES
jgi:hypothetical protein